MAKLQSDRYERGYFSIIWMEYYCLGKNCGSGTLTLKCISSQNPYQLQNLKILLTFQRHKIPHGQNFWKLIFYLKKHGYVDITRTKVGSGSHDLHA